MKLLLSVSLGLLLLASVPASAQAPAKAVIRLDPRLDQILSPDAVVEKVAPGKTFFEGAVWVPGKPGYLIFSDIPGNVINKLGPDGKVSVIVDKIGNTPARALVIDTGVNGKQTLTGTDGTAVDRQGRITYTEFSSGRVMRVEKDGTRTVMADRFEGTRFNSPNDLDYKSDGWLYLTDSGADTTRAADDPNKGLPHRGVYRVKDGKVEMLSGDISPNGIAFSPDEKYLYTTQAGRKLMRFDVKPDGTLANGKIFIDMDSDKASGGPDGLRTDKEGYVYSTGPGGLWIMAPDGTHIGTLLAPVQRFVNMAFGGDDGKSLYLVSPEGVYRVALQTPRAWRLR